MNNASFYALGWFPNIWNLSYFKGFITSYLHRKTIVSKTLFIDPTDAHYYKIIEILKQYKNYRNVKTM
jgi:hypothetical protein